MHRGYIKLWRKSLESSVWSDIDLWRTWCCCLMLASHKQKNVLLNKSGTIVKIKEGQFVTGRESFFQKMYPRKLKSNPHPATVWRWLQALKLMQNLHIETHNKYSIITVINWDNYQQNEDIIAQQNVITMQQSCTNDAPIMRTIKNDKNDKNDKKKEREGRNGVPDWIKKETWDDFREFRIRIKAPLTDRAVKGIVTSLEKLKSQGHDPDAVLEQSIVRGWRGVFPVKSANKDDCPGFDWSTP